MAKKDDQPKKNRMGGFGRYAYGYVMRPIRVTIMLFILRGIGIIIAIALAFFLLSGGINQVKTGETLVEYALDCGERISDFFASLLDGTSPFKFTKDGVYFKDAEVPEEGALDQVDPNASYFDENGDNKVGEWWDKATGHDINDLNPDNKNPDSSDNNSSNDNDQTSGGENGGESEGGQTKE